VGTLFNVDVDPLMEVVKSIKVVVDSVVVVKKVKEEVENV
jgi:hypothetical protein